MATRAAVIAEARTWLGVPWRHQGRSRAGVDCVGLIVVVCQSLGLSDYDSCVYGRDPDPTRFLGHFTAGGAVRINPLDAQDGDLLVFRQSAFPCHAGIRSTHYDVPYVIHAHMAHRQVVEERLTEQAPLVAAYRLPGLEN
ncbi:MAG: C40 family peptidase [Acetobacteraceae bacterium]